MLTRRIRSSRSSTRAGAVRGASHHLVSLSGVGVVLALFAQGLASCGSDDEGGNACEPNALRACAGPAMCAGNQTCASDGSGYSECSCDSGSAGAAGSGGSSGANGGAAGSGALEGVFDPADRVIGAPCNTDADCPVGPDGESPLICITPTSSTEFGNGSPPGGYCTAVCADAADSSDCQAIDGLSICGLLDPATALGYCIALCQPGDGNGLVKCRGAQDLAPRAQACFPFPDDNRVGACFPVCQDDASCGPGQFCDLGAGGLGLCVTTPPPGGDVGAPCTAATAAADCKSGICLTLLDPVTQENAGSFCSANCTFGLIEGCGSARNAPAGTRDAVCIRPQDDVGGGGDIGFCFELCDVDADCEQASDGWVCERGFNADIITLIGRSGECVPPAFAGTDGGLSVDAGN